MKHCRPLDSDFVSPARPLSRFRQIPPMPFKSFRLLTLAAALRLADPTKNLLPGDLQ